jgi:cell division protein FtsZ
MAIHLQAPDIRELKPRITVFGVGGAGGNAVNNMIEAGLIGCEFVVANTDAQALSSTKSERIIQMGIEVTSGLGAGANPEIGCAAAKEMLDEIRDQLSGAHMVFVTAGMGGGTGTGAAPVIAQAAREMGILTVGVVTKPFHFEGTRRMRIAESGIIELQKSVDTLIVIPNQNLFRVANEKTTFADAFAMADQVLYSGVACITDLMVKEGLINLDFADVRSIMRGMGKAMMGTGEASGESRAIRAAEAAIANPLLDDVSMKGAQGLLISITGGNDLTLYEVDEAATRIREEVDQDANIILGATFDPTMENSIRVSVVATGIDHNLILQNPELSATEQRIAEVAERLRAEARAKAAQNLAAQAGVTSSIRGLVPSVNLARPIPDEAVLAAEAARDAARDAARENARQEAAKEAAKQELAKQETARQEEIRRLEALRDEALREQAARQEDIARKTAELATARAQASARTVSQDETQIAGVSAFDRDHSAESGLALDENREDSPLRAVRMPEVEDLPLPAQNQIRASKGETRLVEDQEHKRLSLLQRLATVGFGRKDETSTKVTPEVPPAPSVVRPPVPSTQRPALPTSSYRPAHGQLDAQGRTPPAARLTEEEHLEIPAFLRRQAN